MPARVDTPRLVASLLRARRRADAQGVDRRESRSPVALDSVGGERAVAPRGGRAPHRRISPSRFQTGPNWAFAIFRRERRDSFSAASDFTRASVRARSRSATGSTRHETGHGYITEAVAALTRVAFAFPDIDRLEIRCDPRNVPSAAIPRRIGYRHIATLEKNSTVFPGRAARHDGVGDDARRLHDTQPRRRTA